MTDIKLWNVGPDQWGEYVLDPSQPSEDAIMLSPSMLNDWHLCNYRVLYKSEDWYDARSNEPPAFGTGVHAVIENYLAHGEFPASPAATVELWVAAAKANEYHPEDISQYATARQLLSAGAEMLGAAQLWEQSWWTEVGQHLAPILIEQRIYRPLGVSDGREIWVSGAPDFMSAGPHATAESWDWKTAGRGWKKGKAESGTQHILYPWLAEPLFPSYMFVAGTYVVYDRSKQEWSWDDKRIMLNGAMRESVLGQMWDMAWGIRHQRGTASPITRGGFGDGRGWHCKPQYCGAWNGCPFKYMIDDDVAKEKRPEEMKW